MSKIVVVGSLNMDLVVTTPKIPVIGETLLGSGFMTAPGGKGANQAVAAARLGGQVSMIGRVGGDIFGADLLKNLQANGVDTTYVQPVQGMSNGIAMILVKDGDNCIIVDPGAGSALSPEIIDAAADEIKSAAILVIQLEIPEKTVEKAIETAWANGVQVLLNPAPARKLSDELLSQVSILTPNETECEILTGMPVRSIEDAKQGAAWLLAKGVRQVVVTLGSKGVVYNRGSELIHQPVPEVKVVDTTAAGDSFTGALAVALSRGLDIDAAIDFGNAVGTLTVTKMGAQTSLPTLAEVEAFMKSRNA